MITLSKNMVYTVPLNPTFKANDSKKTVKRKTEEFLVTASLAYCALVLAQGVPLINYKNKITPDKVEWSDTTKVMASGSQKHYSSGLNAEIMKKNNITIKGAYSNKILENLKEGKANSIPQAYKQIEKEGLKRGQKLSNGASVIVSQYPVATPNDVDAWNVNDDGKKRVIFAFGGEGVFEKSVNGFCDEMSDIFSVPEENIIKVTSANRDSVKEGLKKLAKKLKKSNPENTEVLIYYAGHGLTMTKLIPFRDYFLDEGEAKGMTEFGFKEEDLKKFEREHLKGIKTLMIFDTCFSGSWIAKKDIDSKSSLDKTV